MIFALHGFLGLPSDWDKFSISALMRLNPTPSRVDCAPSGDSWGALYAVDLQARVHEDSTLDTLAEDICALATQHAGPHLLLGYSLGGRVAYHALIKRPDLFAQAIIMSAHPGLGAENQSLRQQRIQNDQHWAEKFLKQDWQSLLTEWDAQALFQGDSQKANLSAPVRLRNEAYFSRFKLKLLLNRCSLGQQSDLAFGLTQTQIAVLLVSGRDDSKYSEILARLAGSNPGYFSHLIIDGGHRAPLSLAD